MTDFREELEAQIAFESEKDLTGEWTEEYRKGYVDGLKQALAVVIEGLKPPMTAVKTADEARERAIDWQNWQQYESPSYGELAEWQDYFKQLGKKFNLTDEFKENGII